MYSYKRKFLQVLDILIFNFDILEKNVYSIYLL